MRAASYSLVLGSSYIGTKFLGLDFTVSRFRQLGLLLRKARLDGARPKDAIWRDVRRAFAFLPMGVRCLDQALVTWFLLNLNGHKASMKIGINLAPVDSHAWVESDSDVFVDSIFIRDLHVVAKFDPW